MERVNQINSAIDALNASELSSYEIAKALNVSQTIVSKWRKGEGKPSFINARRILRFFTEEADLPLDEPIQESTHGKLIPLYDAEAAAGMDEVNMAPARPVGMIEIGSILKDSESALRVYGNSMVPNYPAGCVIGLRPHNDKFIEPGTVYVIETAENRYLKRLYYNADKTAFRCVSDNTMVHESGAMKGELYYQDFEIPFADVRKLFRVVGVIKRNIL